MDRTEKMVLFLGIAWTALYITAGIGFWVLVISALFKYING